MNTDITMLLDRTGSMGVVAADTIKGFNTFLAIQQRSHQGECVFTLVQFDDVDPQEVVHDARPIATVPPLTAETFVPRGNTPLLDALGKAVVRTGERLKAMAPDRRPGKVIFVIVTDGQENASHEYTRTRILDMITHQRDTYRWEFVYLGANQDAIKEAATYGIPAAGTATYAHTTSGTRAAFAAMSSNVMRQRSGATNTLTKEEREAMAAQVKTTN